MKVQRVKNFNEKKLKLPCLAAVKEDGVRGLYEDGVMYSRRGNVLKGLDHIIKEIQPYGINLDGELIVPEKTFEESSGLIRNYYPVPDAVYYIFDAPYLSGTKVTRHYKLHDMIEPSEHVSLIPHFQFSDKTQLKRFYNETLDLNKEGIVVYNPNSLYEDKKNWNWMRMVPVLSEDCPVTGFFEGEKRLEGTLGGILVDFKGKEVRVGSGFTDAERDHIWSRKQVYMGEFAEVAYKELTRYGSMRQPRFKRWRFDK